MNTATPRIERDDLEAKLEEVADALNAASMPARQAAWRVGVVSAAFPRGRGVLPGQAPGDA